MEVTLSWSHVGAIVSAIIAVAGTLLTINWKLAGLVRADINTLCTDVNSLRAEVNTLRTDVNTRFNQSDADSVAAHQAIGANIRETRTDLHAEIRTAKTEIRDDVKEVRADLRTWISKTPPPPER